MQAKIILLFLSIIFLLEGCSVFSPVKTEPNNNYILSQLPTSVIKKSPSHNTLLVNYPLSTPALNTTQMAYSTQTFKMAYFSKNQWVAPPSQMLQPLIVQTLQDTHNFKNIVSPGMMGQYDLVLNTQLLQFQQVFFNHSSEVRVVLKAQLIDVTQGNRVISTKEFSATEAAYPTPYGGVVAANRGVAKLLGELARFAIAHN